MIKKIKQYVKFIICMTIIICLASPICAVNSASDGSAFVTKEEFDRALADFNDRLSIFEAGLNSKIDMQVTTYLTRNGIWNKESQTLNITTDGKAVWSNRAVGFCGSELVTRNFGSKMSHIWYAYNPYNQEGYEPTLYSNSEFVAAIASKGVQWKPIIRNVSKSGLLYLLIETKGNVTNTSDNVTFNYAVKCDVGNWRSNGASTNVKNSAGWSQFLYLLNPRLEDKDNNDEYSFRVERYIGHKLPGEDLSNMVVLASDVMFEDILKDNKRFNEALGYLDKDPAVALTTTETFSGGAINYGATPPIFNFGPSQPFFAATKIYMGFVNKGDEVYFGNNLVLPPYDLVHTRASYNWGFVDWGIIKAADVY